MYLAKCVWEPPIKHASGIEYASITGYRGDIGSTNGVNGIDLGFWHQDIAGLLCGIGPVSLWRSSPISLE